MVRRGAHLGLGIFVALAPHRALAECYGSPPSQVAYLVAPVSGATEIPTDTLVWLGFEDPGYSSPRLDAVLVGPDGDEVAFDGPSILAVPFGGVEVWTPRQALQPDSVYQLWRCDLSLCEALLSEFRTGAGPSAGPPPPVPTYLGPDPTYRNGRGGLFARFEFQGLLVVDRADGDVDGPGRSGQTITLSVNPDEPVQFGKGDRIECGNWPFDDSRAALRLGAYDWSGRFSGWSEPTSVVVSGCSVARHDALALVVVLCALRRRRSRPW